MNTEVEEGCHSSVVDKLHDDCSRQMRAAIGTVFAPACFWRSALPLRVLAPSRQAECRFARGGDVAKDKPDVARLVDEAAKAIGLPIAPEYRPNVILNYERAMAIVQPLLEVELDDELTPAPVYRP
jgi:hypothetical protein